MDTSSTETTPVPDNHNASSPRTFNAAQRKHLLGLYKTSGLTQKAFARREGVNFHTFVSWLAHERRATSTPAPARPVTHAAPPGFVEVRAAPFPPPLAAPLEVVLRDGRIARGADPALLATLARLLEA